MMSKRAIDLSSNSSGSADESPVTKKPRHDAPGGYVNYFVIFCDHETARVISEEADLDILVSDSAEESDDEESEEEESDEDDESSVSSSASGPARRRKRAALESDEEEEEEAVASSNSFIADDASEPERAEDNGKSRNPRIVCTLLATVRVGPLRSSHINTVPYADALLAATASLGLVAPTCRPLVQLLLEHTNADSQASVTWTQIRKVDDRVNPTHARLVCAPWTPVATEKEEEEKEEDVVVIYDD